MILLTKAICAGLGAVLVAWIAILVAYYWRLEAYNRKQGVTGLGAVAGGWDLLLQMPIVAIVLSAAFGICFHLTVRWIVRP